MKRTSLVTLLFVFTLQVFSQVYSNKEVGEKNEDRIDSIKKTEYPYILPIWGEKATALGFDLPYSAGFSVNYLQQESSLILSNLSVGFNGGQMYNIDEIVRFDDATARAGVLSLRPDFWLFPFLNVYGIFGKAKSSTEISAGIYVPNSENEWNNVMSFSTKANFEATTAGIGVTPTLGIGGGWMALDMNCAWTDVSALDKPVFTFVFGPRFGKSFKLNKPERNIAVWCGGFRVKFSSETNGSLNLNEIIPTDELQQKVDNGYVKVGEAETDVNNWWDNLSEIEQNNPINETKYNTAMGAIGKAYGVLDGMDAKLNDDYYSTVQYSLDKKLKNMWNFIVGTQYQFNKHYMIRGEIGFLGSRTQGMVGLQYRFGL